MTIQMLPEYKMPSFDSFPKSKVEWPFEPSRAVFLIHDMQEYFLRFYDADSDLITRLINNLCRLKAYCKQQGIPVVYTAQPDNQSTQDRALLNDMWGPGLNHYPEQKKVVAALTPDEEDIVLVKWRYSAFQRSPLEHMMQEMQRDQLLIGGVYGHIGCLMTAVDAFMRDIKPFVVGDALADFSEAEHRIALNYVAGRCGKLVSTDDIVATHETK